MNTPHILAHGLAALAALGATVPADAQTLAPDTVARALALAQEAASVLAPPGARVEVLPGALDSRLRLAPCTQVEVHRPAGTPPWGKTRVGVRCSQGTTAWNVFLPVNVRVLAPAMVGRSALPAGTVLEAGHLTWAEVDWAATATSPHGGTSGLIGRTLARPLAAGQAPRSGDLRVRQWFVAGDTVRVVADGDGYSISVEGRALSNGIDGQTARVRTDSGRVVSGMPVADHRVQVRP